MNTSLLIIDAQNDFCDLPPYATYTPSLPINGAHQDCLRLADWIQRNAKQIDEVVVSLDSHHVNDLAHALLWCDQHGQAVAPFTEVTEQDWLQGRYRLNSELSDVQQHYVAEYLRALAEQGKSLVLWPVHCVIGTSGHNLHATVAEAILEWSLLRFSSVHYVLKGENPWTESFSALKAEIPYPGDASTELNSELLTRLGQSDQIVVAGQASSHCVRHTVQDLLRYGGADMAQKLIVLRDCMSPVAGFEAATQVFFEQIQHQGVRLVESTTFLA